jgi:cell division protein FtsZ
VIYEAVDINANIIFGALVDESMSGEIAITVIATGFPLQENNPILPPAPMTGDCLFIVYI